MTPHETHLRMRPTFKPKTLLLADYHPQFKGMYLGAKTARFGLQPVLQPTARAAGQVSAKVLLYGLTYSTTRACDARSSTDERHGQHAEDSVSTLTPHQPAHAGGPRCGAARMRSSACEGGHACTSGTRKADLRLPFVVTTLKPAAAAPGLRSPSLTAQPGSIPGHHEAPRGQQRSCAHGRELLVAMRSTSACSRACGDA